VITHREPTDGGESPNRAIPEITAQIRLHWPPSATAREVAAALDRAYREAIQAVITKPTTEAFIKCQHDKRSDGFCDSEYCPNSR
jgi:hypothetical protein